MKTAIALTAIITFIFFIIAYTIDHRRHSQPNWSRGVEVNINETYYHIVGDCDNPFQECDTVYARVLDIKEGFVQYRKTNSDDVYSKVSSHHIDAFLFWYPHKLDQ